MSVLNAPLCLNAVRYSAFHYMKNFAEIIPDEFLQPIQKHQEFALKIDAISNQFLSTANCLKSIRSTYTGSALDDAIEHAIDEHLKHTDENPDELRDVSRKIIKLSTRQKMMDLGFIDELEAIHADNRKKYGNDIGPAPSYLGRKYKDKKEISEASKRFRDDVEMDNTFRFK